MKRFTVYVLTDDGGHGPCDAIEHEGRIWLVPYWLNTPDGEWQKPERIIPLDRFQHQKTKFGKADFVLNESIPKAVLSGPTAPQLAAKYGVVFQPDVTLRTLKGLN